MADRRWATVLLVALGTLAVGALAFVVRFNAMGEGPFGGFSNDQFVTLMRAQLITAGEWPLRDFQEAELQGVWPALNYAMPAWAQAAWGPTLLSEAYLTIGALALSTAIVFALSYTLSRSWGVALLAAALVVVTLPRHYNYSKVLALAFGGLVVHWLARDASWRPAAAAALVTALAGLFRHDFAVYVGAAVLVVLTAQAAQDRATALRHFKVYAAGLALLLAPSLVWVQRYQGLLSYLRVTLESTRVESGRTVLRWPAFDPAVPLDSANLVAFTYYGFWALCALALIALAWRAVRQRGTPAARVAGWGLLVLAVLANLYFLRANLTARFGDSAAAVAMTAAWTAGVFPWDRTPGAILAWAAPRLLLAALVIAAFTFNGMRRELERGGFTTSPASARARFASVQTMLAAIPPAEWSERLAGGTLRAARYIAECTDPADRILVGTYAPELPVFSGRLLAAGQRFGFGFYRSAAQQRAALERLRSQPVVMALTGVADHDEFVDDYPFVAEYITNRFREAGTIDTGGQAGFRVFIDSRRPVHGTHPDVGLPCFR